MVYYILLAILVQCIVAYAQYNLKLGSIKLDFSKGPLFNFKNWNMIIAIFLFLITPILSVIIMRTMEFSIFYSFTALNYFFIMLFSWIMLKERFDKLRIMGNVLVIMGVIIFNLSN